MWCVWYMFGMVVIESICLFSMYGMCGVYVVRVCVRHLFGVCGMCVMCQWFIDAVSVFVCALSVVYVL